ncbi:cell division protein FtsL [Niallia taxi]|uniref:Cell division protein FtsL n=1 Tax=Niallia taxi TaxID=2499688 RepID=A0A3S2UHP6_9BACI|nr:cell division protein FtsL [Niallia taxi]MCM3214847.1 cell division protein FtsL [Niallia taxi]MDE5051395.1 cell division protein FtsL [Niallia taxi]MDK8638748.1 cell division protein FtsL [Niallia taxi]MED3964659.1 cell division protein FtsL [Niallia taxi]MED4037713.1 cell division protein FtsL [Niallia taxi]
MSNLARKLQQEQFQHEEKQTVKKVLKQTKSLLSPGEKLIGIAFVALLCFGGVKIVSNQAEIYQVNKDIQIAEGSISKLEKSNKELDIEVKDLSSFERIREVAEKLGLDFSKDNVKVVQ